MTANPFEVTKAVDFDDSQISSTYVDFPGGGLLKFADPSQPMPRFLVGGKGGGRTHLLRYFSYPLQRLRHHGSVLDGLQADGYIGVYFRCGGLNAGRFSGKGQPEQAWTAAFAYYMDIWLSHLAVSTLVQLGKENVAWSHDDKLAFCEDLLSRFDDPPGLSSRPGSDPLDDIAEVLADLQRAMDRSINNAALRREFDIVVRATPGRLIFGAAKAAAKHLPGLKGIQVAYLLDEYENLTGDQQRYVNTLVREKEPPANFIIGSRKWGVRTMRTLSADEENRQGSEYDEVVLEDAYSTDTSSYHQFCRELVRRRLERQGYGSFDDPRLAQLFETYSRADLFLDGPSLRLVDQHAPHERPYFARLRRQLRDSGLPERESRDYVASLNIEDHPLLEKFALFSFYRRWASEYHPSLEAAADARAASVALIDGRASKSDFQRYRHYRDDLFAQLHADCQVAQPYYGLDRFIEMSGFLPRNLLVILKQVTRWSFFLGEVPFVLGAPISLQAQREGVSEASNWFLTDSKALGSVGEQAQTSIRRLGSFLRQLRFSDKPVEVSCATFSTNRQDVSPAALEVLDACVKYSLLVEIRDGLRHRNTGVLHRKYQLNPMLAPLFDLPTARRGVTPLRGEELTTIFDPDVPESEFIRVTSHRLNRMVAPFGRFQAVQGTLL